MLVPEAGRTLTEELPDHAWPRAPRQALSSAEEAGALTDPVVGDSADPPELETDQIPPGSGNQMAGASSWQAMSRPISAEDNGELILLRRGNSVRAISWDMLTAMEFTGQGSDIDSSPPAMPDGISAFVARVLDQLTLSAWLPGALLAASVAVLLQFRSAGSANLSHAVVALTANPIRVLVVIIPLLVIATIVTQAFSFEAIRTLEGYWRRRGPASLARTLMTRRHVGKKNAIVRRLRKAYGKALASAKDQMLDDGISKIVFKVFRNDLLDEEPISLSAKKMRQLDELHENWRYFCKPWHLARIDRLLEYKETYPADSRILPTKLGNLMRATEDCLRNIDGDLESFVFQRYDAAPRPVQLQHNQYRNRLEMYCVLVFVSAVLLALTPTMLLDSHVGLTAIAVISGGFAALSVASYLAAIASASGYCSALRQMDKDPSSPGEEQPSLLPL